MTDQPTPRAAEPCDVCGGTEWYSCGRHAKPTEHCSTCDNTRPAKSGGSAVRPTLRAPEPGEIIDGALSNFINHVRENADVDPQYGVDARHIRDALRRGDLVLASPAPLATTVAPEPTPGAAQRVAQLIEWAERGDLAGVSLDAIRAALYANAPEPTAPDDLTEWECPNCGATTRARMADHPLAPDDLRERVRAVLRLISPDHITPMGRRQIERVLDDDR